MARKRKLNRRSVAPPTSSPIAAVKPVGRTDLLSIASWCGMGAILVATTFFPGDSTSVEQGSCLFWCAISIAWATLVWLRWSMGRETTEPEGSEPLQSTPETNTSATSDWLIDAFAGGLAGWMFLAAFMTSPPGSLRAATNEAWLWVAGAAIFTASRRLAFGRTLQHAGVRVALLSLIGLTTGLAVAALHQQWISLPADIAAYQADPDGTLEQLGIDAPVGSSLRMAFENRLFDGGPTGTFALSNSLAGVLGMGLVATVGMLRTRWRSMAAFPLGVSLIGVALISVALISTGSRTGMIAAMLLVIILLACLHSRRGGNNESQAESTTFRAPTQAMIAGIGLAAIAGMAVLSLGKKEWFAEAPASISFRIQYWRTSVRMALDSPWFGCGPGHFKTSYDHYREPSANEQIADPHNFLMETFTAGGLIAGGLLLALMALIVHRIVRNNRDLNLVSKSASEDTPRPNSLSVIALGGAVTSLICIVGIALLIPQWIDLSSSMVAIPVALAILLFGYANTATTPVDMTSDHRPSAGLIASACVAFLLLHLCLSGGWTVPGIGIWIWVVGGLLTPAANLWAADEVPQARGGLIRRAAPIVVLIVGLLCMVLLQRWSIGPVRESSSRLADARSRQERGDAIGALRLMDEAIAADPWSESAAVTKAITLGWAIASLPASDSMTQRERDLRSQLNETQELVLTRSEGDAAVLRELIGIRMHLYQRRGREIDLQTGETLLAASVSASPSHQWHHAQRAVVLLESGQDSAARESAAKAAELAQLGNNPERSLSRQMLFLAEPISDRREIEPVRRSASDLLQNLLAPGDVQASSTE